ncbi:MAG: CAP domain-containing protein [Clostridia bacterium]|nr:CAP domain-containing protein [Clostridia bacterium]
MKKILSIAVLSALGALVFTANANAREVRFIGYGTLGTSEAECKLHGSDVFGCINADFNGCGIINPSWCIPGVQKPESNKPDIPEVDTDTENDSDSNQNNNQNNQNNNQSGGGSTNQQASYITEILKLVNAERAKYGLSPLSATSTKLNSAAQKRAEEQAVMFSHTRPSGQSWTTVLSEFGVSYRRAGENVAYGQSTPEEVMSAWMSSDGHRANILGEDYTELGVGHYKKNGTDYWSQIFTG